LPVGAVWTIVSAGDDAGSDRVLDAVLNMGNVQINAGGQRTHARHCQIPTHC